MLTDNRGRHATANDVAGICRVHPEGQQSKHSKSLLGELEVLRFQDGHETIDLVGRENELMQS
jgi:hypothetical protein